MKIFQTNEFNAVAKFLSDGTIIAVPTETVYGLAVKYDNPTAIDKLSAFKKRGYGSDKVFTLMLADINQIGDFALENELSRKIAEQNFPGELTLVLPKNPTFHNCYFDNLDTIGIRVPNHEFMLRLLSVSGPLIVTSANHKDAEPLTDSDSVIRELPEIDACTIGVSGGHAPSTVISIMDNKITTLRQGFLTLDKIKQHV